MILHITYICPFQDICTIRIGDKKKMPKYITLQWVTEAPAGAPMSWGNVAILASGNAPDGAENPQLVTSSNYASLIPSTRHEYKALQSYFKNFTGSPSNSTYVYWMGAGEEVTGIAYGTGLDYRIDYGPYGSIDSVWVDPTGGVNWQEIAVFDISTAPSGYTAGTGAYGVYDGGIYFSGVYVDADTEDDGGPYFDSGGTVYSGATARDIMHTSGGAIRILATRNGFGVAAKELIPLDIQFVCPAYEVTSFTGIMGDGTGATEDLLNTLGICAGNRMMTVWALPKDSAPNTVYDDGDIGQEYQNLRDYISQDQNAVVIYADVATGADGSGIDDPAACYLGKIVDTHPHTTLTLAPLTIGLANRTNEQDKAAWDAGQIASIFRKSDLGFSTDQVSYGFSFSGTSPSNRLNNVRCKYIVEYNVLQDLWSLLSSRIVTISESGLGLIIDTINGTLNRLQKSGIIDVGDREVKIPLIEGTPAEWTTARLTRIIPSISVRWSWNTSPERLEITQFGEIL